ncbi:ABC-type phosphate transport system substrate-binding protein [Streptacidiphilus sp. MAP12-20]|uniref:hypothetical protein n=1 Tax=Streptacidiphilus sp. MAP12-20 TaxID=3156299 RepID=UPI0035139B87
MTRARASIRVIAAGLVIAALPLVAACGRQVTVVPAAPVQASSPAPPVASSSSTLDQERLDTAAGAIERLADSYRNSYAGLVVDVPGGRLIVYRKPGSGFDAAVTGLDTGVRIDLKNAPRSISELTATRRRVEALIGHTVGYSIQSVGAGSVASLSDGVVEVGVAGDPARAKRDLTARFGDRVSVVAAAPISAG